MVKICGITNLEDALAAVEGGARALGFNFWPGSPRYIAPDAARELIAQLPAGVWKVGVFVDEKPARVAAIARETGLDVVQLHGREMAAEFPPGFRVWKAIRIGAHFDREALDQYPAEALLLDGAANGVTFDWTLAAGIRRKVIVAGGLDAANVGSGHRSSAAVGRGRLLTSRERSRQKGSRQDVAISEGGAFRMISQPDAGGHFGPYGGRYVPEVLMSPLEELERTFLEAREDPAFRAELDELLHTYAGRPTPLYFARRLTEKLGGARIYLKREDLLHTGAHKINNCLGQALLARRMGKKRIIAETGAGQHGVATATVCALFGFECVVYMGEEDMRRQRLNVFRMRLLGAKVVGVANGSRTLKDAISEAMRDWVTNVSTTHYLLGSALGSHPYPLMVREFHKVIGEEAREQIQKIEGRLPDTVIACVGGGSNAIGIFHAFIPDANVRLVGVEAGGRGAELGEHAARFSGGSPGVLHGARSYLLQDENGQISLTHSVSAGLDYALVGPEHAWLHDNRRAEYVSVDDHTALDAARLLSLNEGIIPALESAHAVAEAVARAPKAAGQVFVVNVSGRGDKDIDIYRENFPELDLK